MPLTLFEAQTVSWKIFRKINMKLEAEGSKKVDQFVIITDLLEEAGEAAGTVKDLEGFKPSEKPKTKEMLAEELSDLLYAIFVLAEHYGINLEETYLEHVNNYLLRFVM